MKVHILASGSKGNAACIEMGSRRFLLDAGVSTRRMSQQMCAVGIQPDTLDGIFITHEHTDHIKGLVTFTKQYGTPVYIRRDTLLALPCRPYIPAECIRIMPDEMAWGDLTVKAFSTLHDAADPVGYTFTGAGEKLGVATDLGFVTDSVKEALIGSDALIFESNHDLEMLKGGAYPWSLKQRIMGSRGHLSNDAAAWSLSQILGDKKATVFLAHLSRDNNEPETALATVETILEKEGFRQGRNVELVLTHPNETVSWENE